MVYLLQMIEHRCRFDDEFELRRVEEPAFSIEGTPEV